MNTTQRLQTLQRIRRLAWLLDSAIRIPGTRFRIGLDPILGLLPGGGDLVGALFSAYMIFLAARFGMSGRDIGRMAGNVALEFVLGTFPLVGDVFDAYFKANARNLEILEKHLASTEVDLESAAREERQKTLVGEK